MYCSICLLSFSGTTQCLEMSAERPGGSPNNYIRTVDYVRILHLVIVEPMRLYMTLS